MKIIIVHEFNSYDSNPTEADSSRLKAGLIQSAPCVEKSSLWIIFTSDAYQREHLYSLYEKIGTKIVGPISTEIIKEMVQQLELAFRLAEIEVQSESFCDD
jgi:hypothetical protein